jgi:hypothetical protein
MEKKIEALLYRVATTADGGCRVTLDLTTEDTDIILKLMALYMAGEPLIEVKFIFEQ